MITFAQALRNAIEAERYAQRFYLRLASNTHDAAARLLLEELAEEEKGHAHELQTLADLLLQGKLPTYADVNMSKVETVPDWGDTDNLVFEAAIRLALECEQGAALYYETMAEGTSGDVAKLFKMLINKEREHAFRLEKVLNFQERQAEGKIKTTASAS